MSASWITSLQSFLGKALERVQELEEKIKIEIDKADKARADAPRICVERNEARSDS